MVKAKYEKKLDIDGGVACLEGPFMPCPLSPITAWTCDCGVTMI